MTVVAPIDAAGARAEPSLLEHSADPSAVGDSATAVPPTEGAAFFVVAVVATVAPERTPSSSGPQHLRGGIGERQFSVAKVHVEQQRQQLGFQPEPEPVRRALESMLIPRADTA